IEAAHQVLFHGAAGQPAAAPAPSPEGGDAFFAGREIELDPGDPVEIESFFGEKRTAAVEIDPLAEPAPPPPAAVVQDLPDLDAAPALVPLGEIERGTPGPRAVERERELTPGTPLVLGTLVDDPWGGASLPDGSHLLQPVTTNDPVASR